jgi:diacylglycerol kinase family enzyme
MNVDRPVFDRILVLVNPWSTHIVAARQRIAQLQAIYTHGSIHIIEIRDDPEHSTTALLNAHKRSLGPKTLLCVAGGDGTVNAVVQYLMATTSPKNAAQTVVLPLWGGNANDLAHMLNGPAYLTGGKELLRKGKVVSIHPLKCELTYPDGKTEQYSASAYIGFGVSAMTAKRLNTLIHRNSAWHKYPGGRFIREFMIGAETFAKISTFHIEEDGHDRAIYERIFINGSRIGKVQALPLKLTDKAFFNVTVQGRKTKLLALGNYLREVFRRPAAELTTGATFVCLDHAWGQADGETFEVTQGTQVRVYRSEQPFYALSTKLVPRRRKS